MFGKALIIACGVGLLIWVLVGWGVYHLINQLIM